MFGLFKRKLPAKAMNRGGSLRFMPRLEVLEDRRLLSIDAGPTINLANGHTYYLLTQSVWTAAEAEAVNLGGHLVTINDAAEDIWVFDTFSRTGQYGLWIGLNDAAREGNFVWSSGEPVTYTNWSGGQPDNYGIGGEDYGMIFVEGHGWPTRKWNDFWDSDVEDHAPGIPFGILQGVVEVPTQPDIAMLSAQLVSGNTVQFTYATTGNLGPFQVGLYRSADGTTYNLTDQIGDLQPITPSPTNPQTPGAFTLPADFQFDPARPYLLVVADPNNAIAESDEGNNTRSVAIPDIELISATTDDSRSVKVTYRIHNAALDNVPLRIYRSADTRIDVGVDPVLALLNPDTIVPGTLGVHTVTLPLAEPLGILPATPHILVQADPEGKVIETVEETAVATNNEAGFRKRVLGVVTHGYNPFGFTRFGFTSWITELAADLRNGQGYDSTVAFDWNSTSWQPRPGMTEQAGRDMARRVEIEIARLNTLGSPTDVVDVHFIGHSRGAVVISQALQNLVDNADIRRGFTKMTMLDPHPAHNHLLNPQYSVVPSSVPILGRLGRVAEAALVVFQAAANDPEAFVPRNVDDAQVYHQHTPWFATGSALETILNLWGEGPVLNLSGNPIAKHDLTGWGMSHTKVVDWYRNNVVSVLRDGETASAFSGPNSGNSDDIPPNGSILIPVRPSLPFFLFPPVDILPGRGPGFFLQAPAPTLTATALPQTVGGARTAATRANDAVFAAGADAQLWGGVVRLSGQVVRDLALNLAVVLGQVR